MSEVEKRPERAEPPSDGPVAAPAVVHSDEGSEPVSESDAEVTSVSLPGSAQSSGQSAAQSPLDLTPPKRGRLQSKKLDRTLAELESAFTDWEQLNTQKAPAPTGANPTESAKDAEFRNRTRKLLLKLREQLGDL